MFDRLNHFIDRVSVQHGGAWYACIVGAIVATVIAIAALQLLPQSGRRLLIRLLTLLGGLFFAIEFLYPVHPMPTPDDPQHVGNFLTRWVLPFGNFAQVVGAWTVGLGVTNLAQVHGKRLMRGGWNALNSGLFFASMIAMTIVGILQQAHPNAINKNLYSLMFDGGLQNLDSTMFSVIAFYIVSAAYRAFRIRSVEATLLLATAIIVMLGQVSIGFMLTNWLPHPGHGVLANLRFEIVRDWILTKANTPAVRAINFGLGVGALAVALRIWLGLERGSYFEQGG